MELLNSKTRNKKKTRRWISWCFVSTFSSFISTTVISLVVKRISGRGDRRAGAGVLLHPLNNIEIISNHFKYVKIIYKYFKER